MNRDAALSAAAKQNLRNYLIGDPVGYAGMALRKVGRLWLSYTIGTHDVRLPAFKAYHLLLVLAGILGLAAALALRRGRAPELWAIALVPLYVTAINVVLVSEARHNLVVMPLLCAGAGIGAAARRPRRPRPDGGSRPGRGLSRGLPGDRAAGPPRLPSGTAFIVTAAPAARRGPLVPPPLESADPMPLPVRRPAHLAAALSCALAGGLGLAACADGRTRPGPSRPSRPRWPRPRRGC